MHGRIQCIWYYFCLLEETKEIALIVAILSFEIKQIKKKKKKQRHQNIYKKQFIACFRSSETERDCKDNDEMEPLEEEEEEPPKKKKNRPKRRRTRERSVGPGVYGNKIFLTIWLI